MNAEMQAPIGRAQIDGMDTCLQERGKDEKGPAGCLPFPLLRISAPSIYPSPFHSRPFRPSPLPPTDPSKEENGREGIGRTGRRVAWSGGWRLEGILSGISPSSRISTPTRLPTPLRLFHSSTLVRSSDTELSETGTVWGRWSRVELTWYNSLI